jgi:hypothetical protein
MKRWNNVRSIAQAKFQGNREAGLGKEGILPDFFEGRRPRKLLL